jgi:hypothetical protein
MGRTMEGLTAVFTAEESRAIRTAIRRLLRSGIDPSDVFAALGAVMWIEHGRWFDEEQEAEHAGGGGTDGDVQ